MSEKPEIVIARRRARDTELKTMQKLQVATEIYLEELLKIAGGPDGGVTRWDVVQDARILIETHGAGWAPRKEG